MWNLFQMNITENSTDCPQTFLDDFFRDWIRKLFGFIFLFMFRFDPTTPPLSE